MPVKLVNLLSNMKLAKSRTPANLYKSLRSKFKKVFQSLIFIVVYTDQLQIISRQGKRKYVIPVRSAPFVFYNSKRRRGMTNNGSRRSYSFNVVRIFFFSLFFPSTPWYRTQFHLIFPYRYLFYVECTFFFFFLHSSNKLLSWNRHCSKINKIPHM